jgi:hypothetical protein
MKTVTLQKLTPQQPSFVRSCQSAAYECPRQVANLDSIKQLSLQLLTQTSEMPMHPIDNNTCQYPSKTHTNTHTHTQEFNVTNLVFNKNKCIQKT